MKRLLMLLSICILINDCASLPGNPIKKTEGSPVKLERVTIYDSSVSMRDEDRDLVKRLLEEARRSVGVGARMRLISERLLGSPYIVKPLTGSLEKPEQFVTRMNGFDCVTYVETVLALSESNSTGEYLDRLRDIRYRDGEISYVKRLHYISDWNKVNVSRGILQDMTQGQGTIECVKDLNWIKDIPPHISVFRYFPKSQLSFVSNWLEDGDLIYFVTSRNGLDFYHMGIIFREGMNIVIRHAARSQGSVVEQDLASFCNKNSMQGFVIMRPKY